MDFNASQLQHFIHEVVATSGSGRLDSTTNAGYVVFILCWPLLSRLLKGRFAVKSRCPTLVKLGRQGQLTLLYSVYSKCHLFETPSTTHYAFEIEAFSTHGKLLQQLHHKPQLEAMDITKHRIFHARPSALPDHFLAACCLSDSVLKA